MSKENGLLDNEYLVYLQTCVVCCKKKPSTAKVC